MSHRRHATEQTRRTEKKKRISIDLPEEYTRKTDGRRRPMPQQIWKGPEIKIHDACETAPHPFTP